MKRMNHSIFGKPCLLPNGSLSREHLVISGHLGPGTSPGRWYGLATASSPSGIDRRSLRERVGETRRGDVAWAATTETLQKCIVMLLVFIVELSRTTPPSRGIVLGSMPADQLLSPARRLCSTDQREEALEKIFEWSILRTLSGVIAACRPRVTVGSSASCAKI
jgi:hypothetical protein